MKIIKFVKVRIAKAVDADKSSFGRSAEDSTSHIQDQSNKQLTAPKPSASGKSSARDGLTKSAEPLNVASAGHQESFDTGLLPPEFPAERTMHVQASTRATLTLPPMTNVDRAQGNRFRQPQETAAEHLTKLQAKNENIKAHLRDQQLTYSILYNELKAERTAHQQTVTKLDRSQSKADQLSKLFAAARLKADRLAKEKVDLKRESGAALKKIQASLEAVLLESNQLLVLAKHSALKTSRC